MEKENNVYVGGEAFHRHISTIKRHWYSPMVDIYNSFLNFAISGYVKEKPIKVGTTKVPVVITIREKYYNGKKYYMIQTFYDFYRGTNYRAVITKALNDISFTHGPVECEIDE
jgi:hypothetical protein